MSDTPHNLYERSRENIDEMYGARNPSSDYGVRSPLHTTVEVVPEEPDDMARIIEYYGPEIDSSEEPAEDPYVPVEEAVPMPQHIRDLLAAQRRRREGK